MTLTLKHRLRNELLACVGGKRPVRVIVIDTFRCGHTRAFNTFVDSSGQSRCMICREIAKSKSKISRKGDRMTPIMKKVLKRLRVANEQSNWVNVKTAHALKRRGLVSVSQRRRTTTGGEFPFSWASLTQNGREWCERHLAKG
jgi:hypothetical protein